MTKERITTNILQHCCIVLFLQTHEYKNQLGCARRYGFIGLCHTLCLIAIISNQPSAIRDQYNWEHRVWIYDDRNCFCNRLIFFVSRPQKASPQLVAFSIVFGWHCLFACQNVLAWMEKLVFATRRGLHCNCPFYQFPFMQGAWSCTRGWLWSLKKNVISTKNEEKSFQIK